MTQDMKIDFIRSDAELRDFCEQARHAGRCAFDTEFVRERTYYPKLALVQLATVDRLAIVDPLSNVNLTLLDELMLDSSVLKVAHAATQDLEIFYHRTNRVPGPLFDTQLAAGMVGLGHQISYARAVQQLLGKTLEKGLQYTDWLRRPLSEAQTAYAANDVRYLLAAHDALMKRLTKLDRMNAFEREAEPLEDPGRFRLDSDAVAKKVKGSKSLKGRQRNVLCAVAWWREKEAQHRDLPRRWIVGDEVLTTIARSSPTNLDELSQIRGLTDKHLNRFGMVLLQEVERALEAPETESPKPKSNRPLGPEIHQTVELLWALLKCLCHERRIAVALVSTNDELEDLVRAYQSDGRLPTEHSLLAGWRGKLFGKEIADFLEGRVSLRIENGRPVFTKH